MRCWFSTVGRPLIQRANPTSDQNLDQRSAEKIDETFDQKTDQRSIQPSDHRSDLKNDQTSKQTFRSDIINNRIKDLIES